MSRAGRIAVLLFSSILVPGTALAESGYRAQYDFADQGDDWYGSIAAPDTRYDFPQSGLAPYSNGDEFDLGYESRVDRFGAGPPTELTRTSLYELYFKFGELAVVPFAGGGGGCNTDGECADGTFCNGVEVCLYGQCVDGAAPRCGDYDSCTRDYCHGFLDECAHDPIHRPNEIRGLSLARPDPATGVAALTWYVQPPSDDYNVYRSQFADLAGLACYQSDVVGTTLTDDGVIAPSGLFIYLVTGFGCGGESTLGFDSDDQQRINPAPCP